MKTPAIAAAFTALVLATAGCGGSQNHAREYPAGAETSFVTLCAGQPNASALGCGCLYQELSKRIPYARFVTVGPAIAREENVSGDDAHALQTAIRICAAKSVPPASLGPG